MRTLQFGNKEYKFVDMIEAGVKTQTMRTHPHPLFDKIKAGDKVLLANGYAKNRWQREAIITEKYIDSAQFQIYNWRAEGFKNRQEYIDYFGDDLFKDFNVFKFQLI